jgi:hypothetical protein
MPSWNITDALIHFYTQSTCNLQCAFGPYSFPAVFIIYKCIAHYKKGQNRALPLECYIIWMICITWKICDEYRYNIQVIFIAYCNSLNKKCILQSIIEILLFILLENFDSQTASYIGSVIGIISLQFAKDFISWAKLSSLKGYWKLKLCDVFCNMTLR